MSEKLGGFGEQFLHEKNPNLHTEESVERSKKREKLSSQKPKDKIFNHLRRLESVLNPDVLNNNSSFDRKERNIKILKRGLHESLLTKVEDIPESYFDNQRRIAREEGRGDIEITEELRNQLTEVIISDQKSSLDNWIEYLASPDSDTYPTWAKYWTFQGMIKLASYDKEKHSFGKRDKGTVAPFPDLNREALAYVVDAVVKKVSKENVSIEDENPEFQKLLEGSNFGKLYAWAIEKATPSEEHELLIIDGEWVKYDRESDHMPLVKSLQGHATGWCTAGETTAKTQLEAGDFYVYYSYDKEGNATIPRVAIRMEEDRIGEVRGVAPEQNIDPYISQSGVLEEKLSDFGKEGERYQKRTKDMKILTVIERRHQEGEELSKEDLRFLYEIDSEIEGFGYQKDPRIKEIRERRDIKEDISMVTGFSKDEISVNIDQIETFRGGIKYYYGDLNLTNLTSVEGLKLPEVVNGSLFLHRLISAEGLKLPEKINGDLNLSSLTSAEELKLPEIVNGDLNLSSLTSAEELKLPEIVNGDLNLSNLTSAEGLKLPETVGGYLNLSNLTSAEGLKLTEVVNGSLYLSGLTSAEGLKLPEVVNGSLSLRSLTSAEGLKLPETVNGDLGLEGLTSAEGLKLPETVGGDLSLRSITSAEGLKLPETLGGYLSLHSLTSAEGLKLPETLGGYLNLRSLTSAEGLKLPEVVGGDLILRSITSAEGLKLPEKINGDLNLSSLTSAEGLKIPEIVNGNLYLDSLNSEEKEKIKKEYPNLNIT